MNRVARDSPPSSLALHGLARRRRRRRQAPRRRPQLRRPAPDHARARARPRAPSAASNPVTPAAARRRPHRPRRRRAGRVRHVALARPDRRSRRRSRARGADVALRDCPKAFGSFLLIALLVVGGSSSCGCFSRAAAQRRSRCNTPGCGATPGIAPQRRAHVRSRRSSPCIGGATAQPAAAAPRTAIPPGFEPAPFVEQAKGQFRKLQAAYDAADRTALAEVMTPEMFARVSSELARARRAHARRK